jgi:hypothetical protein
MQNVDASSTTAEFTVQDRGSLQGQLFLKNVASINFRGGAGIQIDTGGYMSIWGINATLLSESGGGYIRNSGTLYYSGTTGSNTSILMSVNNFGAFDIVTGTLVVNDTSVTGGYSVLQSLGATSIWNGGTLQATNSYWQTGGSLEVPDNMTATLLTGFGPNGRGSGIVELDGGNVILGTSSNFGTLRVGSNINFAGAEWDVKIDAQAGGAGHEDYINALGYTVTTSTQSVLRVTTLQGTPPFANKSWDILDATTIRPSFAIVYPKNVEGKDLTDNQGANGSWIITSPN